MAIHSPRRPGCPMVPGWQAASRQNAGDPRPVSLAARLGKRAQREPLQHSGRCPRGFGCCPVRPAVFRVPIQKVPQLPFQKIVIRAPQPVAEPPPRPLTGQRAHSGRTGHRRKRGLQLGGRDPQQMRQERGFRLAFRGFPLRLRADPPPEAPEEQAVRPAAEPVPGCKGVPVMLLPGLASPGSHQGKRIPQGMAEGPDLADLRVGERRGRRPRRKQRHRIVRNRHDPRLESLRLDVAAGERLRNQQHGAGFSFAPTAQEGQFPLAGKQELAKPLAAERPAAQGQTLVLQPVNGRPWVAGAALERPRGDPGFPGGGSPRHQPAFRPLQADPAANLDEPRIDIVHGQLPALRPLQAPDEPRLRISAIPSGPPRLEQPLHVPAPPRGGIRAQVALPGRRQPEHGPTGGSPVHARDSVIPATAVALAGLQRDQRVDPVLRRRLPGDGGLQIVVARGNEHVERVWRRGLTPFQFVRITRFRRLQEGWLAPVEHRQPPGRVVPVLRREPPQGVRPGRFALRDPAPGTLPDRHRPQLHEEHVPGGPLVGAQGGKSPHAAARHRGKKPR